MNKSAIIQARVDPSLKEEVGGVFEPLGLSATAAITLFYVKTDRLFNRCVSQSTIGSGNA